MTDTYPTEEQNQKWLATLPKKTVATKAIILSDQQNVLLVKPNYKPTWQFPGGGVEAGEAPLDGLLRELREELGFECKPTDFELLDVAFREDQDAIFLMYGYRGMLKETTQLVYQQEELDGYKFESLDRVAEQVSSYYREPWQRILATIQKPPLL